MLYTPNDLPQHTRQDVVSLLQKQLTDAIDLMLQSKQAHRNVNGPHFISLHELFDRINGEVEHYVDLLAERITQFGGTAEGTCQVVAKNTSLREYALYITDGHDHVESLSSALADFGTTIRQAIEQTDQWAD